MKWEPNSSYSKEDLQAMQQDALQRVREMQRRADEALRNAQRSPSHFSTPHPHSGQNTQPNPGQKNGQEPGQEEQRQGQSSPDGQKQNQRHSEHPNMHQQRDTRHQAPGWPGGSSRNRRETNQDPGEEQASPPGQEEQRERESQQQGEQKQQETPQDQSAQEQQNGTHPGQEGPFQQHGFPSQDTTLFFQPPQERDVLGRLLEVLHLDNERLLILLLLFVLYNDGADYTLLLALLYLII